MGFFEAARNVFFGVGVQRPSFSTDVENPFSNVKTAAQSVFETFSSVLSSSSQTDRSFVKLPSVSKLTSLFKKVLVGGLVLSTLANPSLALGASSPLQSLQQEIAAVGGVPRMDLEAFLEKTGFDYIRKLRGETYQMGHEQLHIEEQSSQNIAKKSNETRFETLAAGDIDFLYDIPAGCTNLPGNSIANILTLNGVKFSDLPSSSSSSFTVYRNGVWLSCDVQKQLHMPNAPDTPDNFIFCLANANIGLNPNDLNATAIALGAEFEPEGWMLNTNLKSLFAHVIVGTFEADQVIRWSGAFPTNLLSPLVRKLAIQASKPIDYNTKMVFEMGRVDHSVPNLAANCWAFFTIEPKPSGSNCFSTSNNVPGGGGQTAQICTDGSGDFSTLELKFV